MTINIDLSQESIRKAITRLRQAQQNLRWGIDETVDALVTDGANVAQEADGGMANVTGYMVDECVGEIVAAGQAPVIAEFGAGDATIPVLFENYAGVDVYPGSYSEQVGSGEYAETGVWHFGGKVYRQVEPRGGMLMAREYIRDNSTEIAREVIEL